MVARIFQDSNSVRVECRRYSKPADGAVKRLVAKLAKSFGYAPSVLRVVDEQRPVFGGLTKPLTEELQS
jgi:hypothetical protein